MELIPAARSNIQQVWFFSLMGNVVSKGVKTENKCQFLDKKPFISWAWSLHRR